MAPLDGVLQLDATEDSLVPQEALVTTNDNNDHSFSGIMFTLEACSHLPLHHLEIEAVAVRGRLGQMTVWCSDYQPGVLSQNKRHDQDRWQLLHKSDQKESFSSFVVLPLDPPLTIKPGERRDLYIHSASFGDEGIVYDNQHGHITFEDRCLRILPGAAHLSSLPFGSQGPWGSPWRERRSFVGRIKYSALWNKWSPQNHQDFPVHFQAAVLTMLMGSRRQESLLYLLHEEIVHFILNKCNWDDFGVEQCEEQSEEDNSFSNFFSPAGWAELITTALSPLTV